MKLLITGGHLTPALAVIEQLKAVSPKTKVIFIGRRFSQEKEGLVSREAEEIQKRKLPYYEISAAKFHRTYFWRNVEELRKLLPSFSQVHRILSYEKPDVLLTFGGYLAVPVALWCKLHKIPIVTHEQTKTSGLANQWMSKFVDVVAISHEESKRYFPTEKVVVTGNPVRHVFQAEVRRKPRWLHRVPTQRPLLYVTGGSQGSHVINSTLTMILPELLKKWVVVHQTGAVHRAGLHQQLQASQPLLEKEEKHYFPREWVNEEEVAWLFQHATLVVSRSGANTVQEILLSKVPALFIPLPFAHNNEQYKNAQWLVEQGSAMHLSQRELVATTLLESIRVAYAQRRRLRKNAEKIAAQYQGANAAISLIRLCQRVYAARS